MSDADIRAWARDNGWQIGDRGQLPKAIREAYSAAHGASNGNTPPDPPPDYDPGMTDADFTVSEPGPPPAGDADPMAEKKPRTIKTQSKGWRFGKKQPGTRRKRGPRVPVDDLISTIWRGLAGMARPLPPTSRMLKIQAPVAGVLLEDVVKDTVVDRVLQPIARSTQGAEALAVLVGPPVLVTAMTLNPEAAPFLMPPLRELMLRMVKVAGPKMSEALKQEREFEDAYGGTVDQLIASLFADMPDQESPAAAAEAEEENVRAAQEAMASVA
jgi:hypothetical protein